MKIYFPKHLTEKSFENYKKCPIVVKDFNLRMVIGKANIEIDEDDGISFDIVLMDDFKSFEIKEISFGLVPQKYYQEVLYISVS